MSRGPQQQDVVHQGDRPLHEDYVAARDSAGENGVEPADAGADKIRRASHEVEITDGNGMRVLPRELPAAVSKSTFSRYQSLISRAPERRTPQPAEPEE